MEYLALEEGYKFTDSPDGPFCLDLTHARLLVVSDVPKLHHTRQCPGKAGGHKLPPADKELNKVAMHPFVGPFAPSDAPLL
jgi:hypothetical protein